MSIPKHKSLKDKDEIIGNRETLDNSFIAMKKAH